MDNFDQLNEMLLKVFGDEGVKLVDIKKKLNNCVNVLKNGYNDDAIYNEIFEYEKDLMKEYIRLFNLYYEIFENSDFSIIKKEIIERYNV